MTDRVFPTAVTGFVVRPVLADPARHGRVICLARHRPDALTEGMGRRQAACTGIAQVIHGTWRARPGACLTSPRSSDCRRGMIRPDQGVANVRTGVLIATRQLAKRIAQGYARRDMWRFGVRGDTLVATGHELGIPACLPADEERT
jgi:hypothetical protein